MHFCSFLLYKEDNPTVSFKITKQMRKVTCDKIQCSVINFEQNYTL